MPVTVGYQLGIREYRQPLVDGAVPLRPVATTDDRSCVLDELRRPVGQPQVLTVNLFEHQGAIGRPIVVEVNGQVDAWTIGEGSARLGPANAQLTNGRKIHRLVDTVRDLALRGRILGPELKTSGLKVLDVALGACVAHRPQAVLVGSYWTVFERLANQVGYTQSRGFGDGNRDRLIGEDQAVGTFHVQGLVVLLVAVKVDDLEVVRTGNGVGEPKGAQNVVEGEVRVGDVLGTVGLLGVDNTIVVGVVPQADVVTRHAGGADRRVPLLAILEASLDVGDRDAHRVNLRALAGLVLVNPGENHLGLVVVPGPAWGWGV